MRSSILLLGAALGTALAHPGHMGGLIRDLSSRQAPPNQTVEMIGDLATEGATTDVGKKVKTCLEDPSGASCEDSSAKTYTPPGPLGSSACEADTCCVWDFVAKDLVKLFTSENGTCNSFAHAAVRFGFHDAGAWSKTSGFGGADGSLLTNDLEISRSENNGLQAIKVLGNTLLTKYEGFGVGSADLVQFMHNVAVVVCPLGPRQITFIGRADSSADAPTGLLPDTRAPVTDLLQLFLDKTIGTIDLISLIGAHTTAIQRFVDPANAGPLDTTSGIWDVAFYSEALAAAPAPGTFRLPSDDAFSKDNRTTRGFTVFSDPTTGQATWNAFYSKAYTRLSLLGVNTINDMVECTKVLPNFIPVFPVPSNSTSSSSSSVAPSSTSSVISSSLSTNATATSSSSIISSSSAGPIVTGSSSSSSLSSSSVYYSNSTVSSRSLSYSSSSTPGGPVVTSSTSSMYYPSSVSTPGGPVVTSSTSSIYYPSSVSTPAGPTVTSKTSTPYTTSTVYSTTTYTITSCPPYVTDCPAQSTKVVTSVIAISTTICPVSAKTTSSSSSSTPASPVVPLTTYTLTTTITETYPSPCPWTSTYVSSSKTFTTSGTSTSTVTAVKTNTITVTKPKPTSTATSGFPVKPVVPTSPVYYSSSSSTPAAPVLKSSSVPAAPIKPVVSTSPVYYSSTSSTPAAPVWGKTAAASGTGVYYPSNTAVSPVKFTGAASKNSFGVAALAGAAAAAVAALF